MFSAGSRMRPRRARQVTAVPDPQPASPPPATPGQARQPRERIARFLAAELAKVTAQRDGLHEDRARLTTALADTTEERDEARDQLASVRDELDDTSESWIRSTDHGTRMTRERDEARAVAADILNRFGPSGSGHTARVGQVQIAKWRQALGMEPQS